MERVLARLWMKDQAVIGTFKKQQGSFYTLTDAFKTRIPINEQDITTYSSLQEPSPFLQTMLLQAGKDFWSLMDLAKEAQENAPQEPIWTKDERILAIQYGNGAICMGMAFSDAPLEDLAQKTIELYNAREFFCRHQLSKTYKAYCASLGCMVMPGNAHIPIQSIKKMIDMLAFLRKEDGAIYNIPVAIGALLEEIPSTIADSKVPDILRPSQNTWEMSAPREEKKVEIPSVIFERAFIKPPQQYDETDFQRFKEDLESKGFNLSRCESAED